MKNNLKRILAMSFALVLALGVIGCSSGGDNNQSNSSSTSNDTTTSSSTTVNQGVHDDVDLSSIDFTISYNDKTVKVNQEPIADVLGLKADEEQGDEDSDSPYDTYYTDENNENMRLATTEKYSESDEPTIPITTEKKAVFFSLENYSEDSSSDNTKLSVNIDGHEINTVEDLDSWSWFKNRVAKASQDSAYYHYRCVYDEKERSLAMYFDRVTGKISGISYENYDYINAPNPEIEDDTDDIEIEDDETTDHVEENSNSKEISE